MTLDRYTLINCRKQFPNTSLRLLKDILCFCLRERAITGGLWEGVYVVVAVAVAVMMLMMMMLTTMMMLPAFPPPTSPPHLSPLQFRSAGHAATARAVPAPPARNAGDARDRHSRIISILLLLLSFSSPPSPKRSPMTCSASPFTPSSKR